MSYLHDGPTGPLWPEYTEDEVPWHNHAPHEGCPSCVSKEPYHRDIDQVLAGFLEVAYEAHGTRVGHWPSLRSGASDKGGQRVLLKHWGLAVAADASKKDGFWAVTELGRRWLEGDVRIPFRVWVFDDRCLGFTPPFVSLSFARATPLDRRNLIRGGGGSL